MKIDRVVVTSYPGYFFMSVLCLRSIFQYLPDTPVTILIDDFHLDRWPSYLDDYKTYINQQFPNHNIEFLNYSSLDKVDDGKSGGWFRQQLIKLHVDYFVAESNILLIDADVILYEYPDIRVVPAVSFPLTERSKGFKLYCQYMLETDLQLGPIKRNLGSSWVPFRFVTRELLQALRAHVENIHGKNFLDLHIELMKEKKIVAHDPEGQTMVMSEFEMLEIFRKHFWKHPLPVWSGTSKFFSDTAKDWQRKLEWFEKHNVIVDHNLWARSQCFGSDPTL